MKIAITSFHFPSWQISVGSDLAPAAWGAFPRAAQDIKTNGTFNLLANSAASADLNELFREK